MRNPPPPGYHDPRREQGNGCGTALIVLVLFVLFLIGAVECSHNARAWAKRMDAALQGKP